MSDNKMKKFLAKSEELRNGFTASLEAPKAEVEAKWIEHFDALPDLFKEIYEVCDGTSPEIEEQAFWDFLPGYRLMQADEVIAQYEQEFAGTEWEMCIPFLTDYASSYYAYAVADEGECIVLISEDGVETLHASVDDFWDTVIAFYDEGVYFLDEDGYLSYDFEKEGEVGQKYNPEVGYWSE